MSLKCLLLDDRPLI